MNLFERYLLIIFLLEDYIELYIIFVINMIGEMPKIILLN